MCGIHSILLVYLSIKKMEYKLKKLFRSLSGSGAREVARIY